MAIDHGPAGDPGQLRLPGRHRHAAPPLRGGRSSARTWRPSWPPSAERPLARARDPGGHGAGGPVPGLRRGVVGDRARRSSSTGAGSPDGAARATTAHGRARDPAHPRGVRRIVAPTHPAPPRASREDPSDGRDPEPDRARSGAGLASARSGAGARPRPIRRPPDRARAVSSAETHPATSRLPGRGAGPRARSGPGLLLVPGDRPRLLHRADPDRPRAELAVRAPGVPPLRRDRPAAPHRAVGDLPPAPGGRGSAFAGPPTAAGELHEDGRRDRGRDGSRRRGPARRRRGGRGRRRARRARDRRTCRRA